MTSHECRLFAVYIDIHRTKMFTCPTNVSSFDNLQEGCCRQTHVNPFTWDLHVVGFE